MTVESIVESILDDIQFAKYARQRLHSLPLSDAPVISASELLDMLIHEYESSKALKKKD